AFRSLQSQQNCVPARRDLVSLRPHLTIGAPPAHVYVEQGVCLDISQAQMDVRGALARMTRAAVDLAHQTPAIGQVDRDRRADGRSAWPVGLWMTLYHQGLVSGLGADRQPQV